MLCNINSGFEFNDFYKEGSIVFEFFRIFLLEDYESYLEKMNGYKKNKLLNIFKKYSFDISSDEYEALEVILFSPLLLRSTKIKTNNNYFTRNQHTDKLPQHIKEFNEILNNPLNIARKKLIEESQDKFHKQEHFLSEELFNLIKRFFCFYINEIHIIIENNPKYKIENKIKNF